MPSRCRWLRLTRREFLSGMAAGAFLNDGWIDIYLINSGKCDFFTPDAPPLRNALYKNNRDGTFIDATEKAGVAAGGFGQGVAVGDYDGDGFPDLYVTQYGRRVITGWAYNSSPRSAIRMPLARALPIRPEI